MYKPKVIFSDSIEKDAKIFCFIAQNITRGLYQKGGYAVLPYLADNYLKSVHFPDFTYSSNFWKKVARLNIDYDGNFPDKLTNEVKSHLTKYKTPQGL